MRAIFLLLILFSSSLYADFQGDGEYSKKTSKNVFLWFDFHHHELVLPAFPLNKAGSYRWEFQGYCSKNGSFSLGFITESNEEQTWWQDETNIEVEILNSKGQSLFKRTGALNSYQANYKSRNCSVITWQECPPLEYEWTTIYYSISDYGGRPHEAISIVLSSKDKKTSVKKTAHNYYNVVHNTKIGCGKYSVYAKVNKPFWEHGVNGRIRILSGWK